MFPGNNSFLIFALKLFFFSFSFQPSQQPEHTAGYWWHSFEKQSNMNLQLNLDSLNNSFHYLLQCDSDLEQQQSTVLSFFCLKKKVFVR